MSSSVMTARLKSLVPNYSRHYRNKARAASEEEEKEED